MAALIRAPIVRNCKQTIDLQQKKCKTKGEKEKVVVFLAVVDMMVVAVTVRSVAFMVGGEAFFPCFCM